MYIDKVKFAEAVCEYNKEHAYKLFHRRFLGKYLKKNTDMKLGDTKKKNVKLYLKYLKEELNKISSRSRNQNSSRKRGLKKEREYKLQEKFYKEIYKDINKNLVTLDYFEVKNPNDYIGNCFLKMAKEISKLPSYYCYTFKDEMVLEAVFQCIKYIGNFSYYNKEAMGYFTSVIMFSFIRTIKKEKKHTYIKSKLIEDILHFAHIQDINIEDFAIIHLNDDNIVDFEIK